MRIVSFVITGAFLMAVSLSARAENFSNLNTKLTGLQETPAIFTNGTGIFEWVLDRNGTSISYLLAFTALSSTTTVAHIHFGQKGVAGGVMAFLCGGGGKPPCPPSGGTVTGKIMASDILAIPAQGVDAGNFAQFLTILRSGKAYANVHSTMHPGGEIRGQIRKRL